MNPSKPDKPVDPFEWPDSPSGGTRSARDPAIGPTAPAPPNGPSPAQGAAIEPRGRPLACFVLMMAAIFVALGPKIRLSQWGASADSNAGIAEGNAWLKGRLDLPPFFRHELHWDYPTVENPGDPEHRLHDTAFNHDKIYNVFPPLVSILTVALAPFHSLLLDGRTDFWLKMPYVLLVFWPLPIAAFVVFRRRVGDSAWAAFLAFALIGGTAVLANLHGAQSGYLGQINHVVSQVGLLILAADALGRQRIWPGLLGLLIATYTRQITFLYGLVLLWIAWRRGGTRKLAFCALGLAVIAAPLLTLNYLKFGDPLEFGYRYIYVGRDDDMAARSQRGVFSTEFIAENAFFLHLAPPDIDLKNSDITEVKISESNQNGTSLWITTPLALWVLIALRRWWRQPAARVLMLGTLPVMFGLLCYHSPGYMEHGYNRFALDFMPIWLLVVAPFTRNGWRTWLTLWCAAWSLLYFQQIVGDAPLRQP